MSSAILANHGYYFDADLHDYHPHHHHCHHHGDYEEDVNEGVVTSQYLDITKLFTGKVGDTVQCTLPVIAKVNLYIKDRENYIAVYLQRYSVTLEDGGTSELASVYYDQVEGGAIVRHYVPVKEIGGKLVKEGETSEMVISGTASFDPKDLEDIKAELEEINAGLADKIDKTELDAVETKAQNALDKATEVETNLENKQDKIENLADIIANAEAFNNSVAKDITAEQIEQWNNATSFSGQYDDLEGTPDLTQFLTEETDPVFTASPAAGITQDDIDKWNTKAGENGYDDTLIRQEIAGKQDAIDDLEEIRTKAGSALQEHQDISGKQDVINDLQDIRDKANSALQAGALDEYAKVVDFVTINGQKIIGEGATNITISEATADVTTTANIQIIGGPLANNVAETGETWPDIWKDEEGNNIIPAGTTLQEVLTTLFSKVINGTLGTPLYTWPVSLTKPTISLSQSGTVEVGTKLNVSAALSNTVSGNSHNVSVIADKGYFTESVIDGETQYTYHSGDYGQFANGSATGDAEFSYLTFNGEDVVDGDEVTVAEGVNKLLAKSTGVTVSVPDLTEETIYAATNTKQRVADVSVAITAHHEEAKELSSAEAEKTITGARFMFWGAVPSMDTLDSDLIRGLAGKSAVANSKTITAGVGDMHMIIACPKSANKSLVSVKNVLASNAESVSSFIKQEEDILVEGANGYEAVAYDVWVYTAGTTFKVASPFDVTLA